MAKFDITKLAEPVLTAEQFTAAQRQLGISDAELGVALGLSWNGKAGSPANSVRQMKKGKRRISGPVALAMVLLASDDWPAWMQDLEWVKRGERD